MPGHDIDQSESAPFKFDYNLFMHLALFVEQLPFSVQVSRQSWPIFAIRSKDQVLLMEAAIQLRDAEKENGVDGLKHSLLYTHASMPAEPAMII